METYVHETKNGVNKSSVTIQFFIFSDLCVIKAPPTKNTEVD